MEVMIPHIEQEQPISILYWLIPPTQQKAALCHQVGCIMIWSGSKLKHCDIEEWQFAWLCLRTLSIYAAGPSSIAFVQVIKLRFTHVLYPINGCVFLMKKQRGIVNTERLSGGFVDFYGMSRVFIFVLHELCNIQSRPTYCRTFPGFDSLLGYWIQLLG